MKRLISILALLCLLQTSIFAQISKKEADALIQAYLSNNALSDGTWLYSKSTAISNATIPLVFREDIKSPSKSSYVYFLDEDPYAGWVHACRFLFVQASNGNITSTPCNMPPIDLMNWDRHFVFNETVSPNDLFSFDHRSRQNYGITETDNCYAVIIDGGVNSGLNWIRYWNDCAAVYSALTYIYGYKDENIYVIMSDGTDPGIDRFLDKGYDSSPLDLDGDGDDDTMYAATKANITIVFNELADKLTQNDHLFIYTTGHGGPNTDGSVYMDLWGDIISPVEFANEVNKVNAKTINIVMQQCFSGGFIPALSQKGRTVTTACAANETSKARGRLTYDEFTYHWISAVAGHTPNDSIVDADSNNDGYVSMKEAFDYAEAADTKNETPQYSSIKSHYGEFLTLLGDNLCSTVYASNETYNTDTLLYGCDVSISNVSVTNNAKLSIESMGSTTLNSGTTIELGSSLEIK